MVPRPSVPTVLLWILAASAQPPAEAWGQDPAEGAPGGWNDSATLELVERARDSRAALASAGDLETYRSLAEGHVYFFLDPERGERSLIRIDQVAVEVDWRAPGRVRQRIVGERSETRLPIREFDYYLDRVTLVPYGFGDEIRIGEGMDVAGVPHPLGPRETAYDFRLADSLQLRLPGRSQPVRLFQLDVRPRDPSAPGVLGTLTLDGASAQIVRMALTFTPSSYVDPRTDWISVEIDHGLWEDSYWLPNIQRIEVRRELPEIDLGVGTVIRSVLRVRDYELNAPERELIPLLLGPVTRAPPAERRGYVFGEGLYDGLSREGLAELGSDEGLQQLRAQAGERLGTSPPSALSPVRLRLPGPSTLVRYSRAEGLVPGLGGTVRPHPAVHARGVAGYAIGPGHVTGNLELEALLSSAWTARLDLRHQITGDLGLAPASDPLVSSLGAIVRGEDYRDPYFRTGFTAGVTFNSARDARVSMGAGLDRVETAGLASDVAPLSGRSFRAIRPITEGTLGHLELGLRFPVAVPAGGRGRAETTTGLVRGRPGTGLGIDALAEARWGTAAATHETLIRIRGWSWWGDPLPQGHRLLGGRGTVPGFPFRTFAGRRAVAGSVETSSDAGTPFVRIRAALHAGWSGGVLSDLETSWAAGPTGGIRTSASVGLGPAWDLVRIDLARGLGGGEWQLLFSIDPAWWSRL